MELIINIDENSRKQLFDIANNGLDIPLGLESRMIMAIVNGTPLPEHHGDLVERSYLIKKIEKCIYRVDRICADDIYYAPTIIPATKEGENE